MWSNKIVLRNVTAVVLSSLINPFRPEKDLTVLKVYVQGVLAEQAKKRTDNTQREEQKILAGSATNVQNLKIKNYHRESDYWF